MKNRAKIGFIFKQFPMAFFVNNSVAKIMSIFVLDKYIFRYIDRYLYPLIKKENKCNEIYLKLLFDYYIWQPWSAIL